MADAETALNFEVAPFRFVVIRSFTVIPLTPKSQKQSVCVCLCVCVCVCQGCKNVAIFLTPETTPENLPLMDRYLNNDKNPLFNAFWLG